MVDGSSPLARGTFFIFGLILSLLRLIPARAGNMILPTGKYARAAAHPRSRGEHSERRSIKVMPCGSSPLARGTYTGGDDISQCARLIPARAGNITVRRYSARICAAHPRSRGEHLILSSLASCESGSSPLARGTWSKRSACVISCWLIPARAGNMVSYFVANEWTSAHPRSRGEHRKTEPIMSVTVGSSPLARGT